MFLQVRELSIQIDEAIASSEYLQKEAIYHENLATVSIPDLVIQARSQTGDFIVDPKIVNVADPGKVDDRQIRMSSTHPLYWSARRQVVFNQLASAIQ